MGQSSCSLRDTIRKDAFPRTQIFLLYWLCSEPYHLPLEADETGFFQECVGRIAKGQLL